VYRRIAHLALAEHGLDPLGDPEQLALAEGLRVSWRGAKAGCGIHVPGRVVVRWDGDARERGLVIAHERAHHHLRRYGAPLANESDAWLVTLELVLPWRERARWPEARHAPEWLIGVMGMRKAA